MSIATTAARPASDSRPDWRDDAACRDADPDLFFPDGYVRSTLAQVKTAKLICRGCPVSTTCLSWALASGQEHGIWGGLTEDERRRLRRRDRPWAAERWSALASAPPDPGRLRRLSASGPCVPPVGSLCEESHDQNLG